MLTRGFASYSSRPTSTIATRIDGKSLAQNHGQGLGRMEDARQWPRIFFFPVTYMKRLIKKGDTLPEIGIVSPF